MPSMLRGLNTLESGVAAVVGGVVTENVLEQGREYPSGEFKNAAEEGDVCGKALSAEVSLE